MKCNSVSEVTSDRPYVYGYPDGTFRPEQYITRGEIAVMLGRLLNIPGGYHGDNHFKDLIEEQDRYIGYINNLANAGIIRGYKNRTFKPERKLARSEFEQLIERVLKKYEDIGYNIDQHKYKKWKETNINKVNVKKGIKRAEAVKVLNELFERKGITEKEVPFKDVNQAHWAYEEIVRATNKIK